MCCGGGDAKWKREVINDHKFDFVDVDEFYENRFLTKFKYCFVFLFTIKSILIYVLDIYTAVMLIFFNSWTSGIDQNLAKLDYIRWIFVGSILASYVLLFFEAKKARAVILSGDISFTFTSIIANRYYTLRSYAHYCLFNQIHKQKRFKDELAFFVFFALKGWKRLFFAEAPRRFVNGYTLFFSIKHEINQLGDWYLGLTIDKKISLITMAIPCILFIISAIRTIFAAILYIPLVCEIRGNLKEYCCHKIDKRIAELLRTRNRKRIMREQMLNGTVQPTKPNVEVFDEEIMMQSVIPPPIDAIEKKHTVRYNTNNPEVGALPPRGTDYGARRMSKGSLVSESTTTSGTSDRRGHAIAAHREYRTKQQRNYIPQTHQQGPTLPQIDSFDPELMAGEYAQGQVFSSSTRPMLHPGNINYIPVDSRSTSDCSERSSSTPQGYLPGPTSHYAHASPYVQQPSAQYNYEMPIPMQMPQPEIYSPPLPRGAQIAFNNQGGGDIQALGRPVSPTHSETSSRSASTHPSRGYQMNMTTVHEEIPNRYQDHHSVNRTAQSREPRAKPSINNKNTSVRSAINF
ncbi:Potassium transporter [Basidiobolus ranarum]|uniref:Potassium transporter n=1 Tax=Basidiobolus ranarum TaxID=34480 RepID=A0ABR2WKU3_9FUNG